MLSVTCPIAVATTISPLGRPSSSGNNITKLLPSSSTVTVKGAFIHFEYWYNSNEAKYLRHILDTKQKYRQMGYQYNDKMCSFYTRDESGATHPAYLMMKINYKPIEEADYDVNVHQLKAVIKRFEQEKIESEQQIEDLQQVLGELEEQMEWVQSALVDKNVREEAY